MKLKLVRLTIIFKKLQLSAHLIIGKISKWSVSQTPYLIHDTTKAPHITGSGVFIVINGLHVLYHLINGQLLVFYTSGDIHFSGTIPPCDTYFSSTKFRDIPKSLIYSREFKGLTIKSVAHGYVQITLHILS